MIKIKDDWPFLLITLIYVIAWVVVFSRLEGGVHLVLALLAALAYAAGQIYAKGKGYFALSADPFALPAGAVVTALATWVMVSQNWMHGGVATYVDILGRFLTAFLLGHVAGLGTAFVADRFTRN